MKLASRSLFAVPVLASMLACGGAATDPSAGESDVVAAARLIVHGTLAPQSFVHDSVSDGLPQVAWSFSGSAGDVVAPDVWPTGSSALKPTLKLLGPAVAGKRSVVATGTPRGQDDAHLAIDGFHLPKTGSYLVLVGEAAPGKGGQFTLRLWTSASHAPRNDLAQLDLALRESDLVKGLISRHAGAGAQSGSPWSDADLDEALADVHADSSKLSAMSDAEQLVLAVSSAHDGNLATDAQLSRARQGAAALVGTAPAFGKLPAQHQAFALFWLGQLSRAVFSVREVAPTETAAALTRVSAQIASLVASWPGAKEDAEQRHVRELSSGGAVYGYACDWSASVADSDGRPVFTWLATDFFDARGTWLGQQSAGASEPDDD